ncbi:TraX family protein, partial [Klebsiella pneumoniae]|uniref:TraX family protein n=1 Tax=Klebsiella pneumoniae TaxID=573 RepID=UPI00359D55F3
TKSYSNRAQIGISKKVIPLWRPQTAGPPEHFVVFGRKIPRTPIGYPWYSGNILFAFAVTGQVLRWVSQPSWYYTLPAAGLLVIWIPLSTASYGMAGVGMLAASWLLCRAQHAPERLVYGVLWALMVLLMNMHDVSESVAGLAIALLTLMVCSSSGERVKRFWPRHFFAMFYAVHLAVLGIVVSM